MTALTVACRRLMRDLFARKRVVRVVQHTARFPRRVL
jgi:hypothetical protein